MTTSIVVRAALAAFIPGIVWLVFVLTRTRYDNGAKKLVAALLFGSIGAVAVGLVTEIVVLHGVLVEGQSIILVSVTAGVVEEASKFGVTALITRRSRNLIEPVDGMIYASSTALGFAAFETTLYILIAYRRVLSTGVSSGFAAHLAITRIAPVRAVTGSLGHAAWAGLVGFAYGLVRTDDGRRTLIFWFYVLAAGSHALYDGLLFDRHASLAIAVLGISVAIWIVLFVRAWNSSPIRAGQLRLVARSSSSATDGHGVTPAPFRPDLWFATHTAPDAGLFAWADPELTSDLVCTVPPGTELHQTGRQGDWAQVSLRDGRTGWVVARLLIPAANAPPSPSVP